MEKINFKALINQYSKTVLNTAIRILRDDQRALDVHQEVFLEMLRRWHKFNGQTNWGAYLYRTTVRKAVESARLYRRQPLAQQQLDFATDKKEQPDCQMRAAELQQKLDKCLGKLPRSQAEVFVLCRIEGLEHRRVAEILGCSREAVGVHLHRAMRRLSKELRGHLGN